MSTLGTSNLTLADWAKRLDPSGNISDIVELLGQTNGVLQDMRFLEGNLPTGHRTTVRTGLPTVAWRLLNAGVSPSKSSTAQIDEQCGMLEAWSEVDVDLAALNGDINAFRMSEARAFLEAMNEEMAQTLFYGNAGLAPEEFTGFTIRYSSTTAGNGANVLKAGSSDTDNSSIWLVVWGDNTVHGIFPKGSHAGIVQEDLGKQVVYGATGIGASRMQAYVSKWQWKAGLALKDWRYAARICNIDISALVANSSAADLTTWMIKAIHRIPQLSMGRAVFYLNRTCYEFLDIQGRSDIAAGGMLSYQNIDGQERRTFRGIPVVKVDQLLETEALVS